MQDNPPNLESGDDGEWPSGEEKHEQKAKEAVESIKRQSKKIRDMIRTIRSAYYESEDEGEDYEEGRSADQRLPERPKENNTLAPVREKKRDKISFEYQPSFLDL
jgi:hypothetical protein